MLYLTVALEGMSNTFDTHALSETCAVFWSLPTRWTPKTAVVFQLLDTYTHEGVPAIHQVVASRAVRLGLDMSRVISQYLS
jgi:hypothetical protein